MRSSYVLSLLVATIVAIFLFGQFQRAEVTVNSLNQVLSQAQKAIR